MFKMQFFEVTQDQRNLGDIGRKMMDAAPYVKDDKLSNKMSELGNRLTTVGALFGCRVEDFTQEEQDFTMNFNAENTI